MKESYTATPRLLYVALQLFLKQGFASTSLDQICRTTGVSKGAFFHYYRSKDEAGEAAIAYFKELLAEYLFSGLEYFDTSKRLERVAERMKELPEHLHFANGSLFIVMANEVTAEQTGIRERLSEAYLWWANSLARLLEDEGRNSGLSLALAKQWIAVYEGAIAQAKVLDNKATIGDQLEQFYEMAKIK
jgi:TetR/AcrR family transcriptional repressor of nem operon